MIPTRLFSGKIKIIRAYLGKFLIFQSVALLFANAKLKLQNNLSPRKAEARVLSCYKEDATKSNPSVTTASAAEISFGKEMRAKIASTLIAYRRAALVYVKRIEARLLGKMQSAAGKVATSIRNMVSRLLALLACAMAKVLHLGNIVHMMAASDVSTSGTKTVTAARAMRNETGINPANVAGIAVNVSPIAGAAHLATLTTFAEPEPGADDILSKQQLTFKKNHGGYTSSYGADATLSIALVEGASYIIEWDGKLYSCVARYARWEAQNIGVYSGTCLGDMKNIPQFFFLDTIIHEDRGGGNDEPFFIHASPGETRAGIETLDTSATHTVRIYTEQ